MHNNGGISQETLLPTNQSTSFPRSSTVSVVVPARDRASWIGRAIDSALAQTHQPGEILVVDDGSTDGTAAAVLRYGPPVRLIRQPAAGAYVARNRAIREASGSLIAFLDSDDAWLPDKLARQLPLFADPEVGVVFGDAAIRKWDGDQSTLLACRFFDASPPGDASVRRIVFGLFVPFSSAMVRRTCFDESGLFSEESRIAGDYRMFFRLACRTRFAWVPEPVFEYSLHSGNWSGRYGQSLASRFDHFREELAATADPVERRLIEQLLYNLELHTWIARVRGRVREDEVRAIPRPAIRPLWMMEFARHQIGVRLGGAVRRRMRR